MLTGKIEQIECTSPNGVGIEEKCTCCRCRSRNDKIREYKPLEIPKTGSPGVNGLRFTGELSPSVEDILSREVTEKDCPRSECAACDFYDVCNLPKKGSY
jgi:hypothetical protein